MLCFPSLTLKIIRPYTPCVLLFPKKKISSDINEKVILLDAEKTVKSWTIFATKPVHTGNKFRCVHRGQRKCRNSAECKRARNRDEYAMVIRFKNTVRYTFPRNFHQRKTVRAHRCWTFSDELSSTISVQGRQRRAEIPRGGRNFMDFHLFVCTFW